MIDVAKINAFTTNKLTRYSETEGDNAPNIFIAF